MTVRVGSAGHLELTGLCSSSDAETLLQHLLTHPGAAVDWRECRGAHTAVIQVLMASRRHLIGPPADARLQEWVDPVMARSVE